MIDELNPGINLTLIARQMSASDVILSTTSDIVFYYPSQLKFRINNNNDLPAYSYVVIVVPSTITVDANSFYCMYNGLVVGCTYDNTTLSITTSYLSTGIILAGTLDNADFIIANVYNPTSTQQTSSFSLSIKNINNQII